MKMENENVDLEKEILKRAWENLFVLLFLYFDHFTKTRLFK
jgi:hypothetical protein